jgi:hypothetical protein
MKETLITSGFLLTFFVDPGKKKQVFRLQSLGLEA